MQYTGINHGLLWQHAIGMARRHQRTGESIQSLVVNHPFFVEEINHNDIARITGGDELVFEYELNNQLQLSAANRAKMGARIGWMGYVDIAIARINE